MLLMLWIRSKRRVDVPDTCDATIELRTLCS